MRMRIFLGRPGIVLLSLMLLITGHVVAKEKVVIWTGHDFDVRYGDVDKVLWGPFEEAHPDIDVTWERKGNNEVIVASAGGQPPDIFAVDGINVPAWAEQGLLAQLDRVIPQEVAEDYWPPCLEEMMWKGHLYALGLETNSHLLFYNKDHFAKYGILEPPKYWDELVKTGRRLTLDKDGDGKLDQFGLDMTLGWGEYGMWICSAFIWQNNGDIVTSDGEVLLDEPESMEAFQFLADLTQEYHIIPLPGESEGGFYGGFMSMMISGPFNFGPLEKNAPDLEWGATHTPYPRDGKRVSGVGGWHFAMSPEGVTREAAREVMRYISSPTFVTKLSESYGIAVRRSVAAEIDRLQKYPWNIAIEQMMYGKARPRHPQYPRISEIVSGAFVQVMADGKPVKAVVQNAADALRAELQ